MTERFVINTGSDSENESDSESDDYNDNEPMLSTSHGTQIADDFMIGISPLSDSD